MTYRIPLPAGGRTAALDILEPNSTAVQRFIRREGIGRYEPSTSATVLALCELADPGFVMFDVGANMGLYSAYAAAMFEPSVVHAFEPTPRTADVARRIMAKNRLPVDVIEKAVGDSTGAAELHLSPVSDASNSMIQAFKKSTHSIEIEMITLDDHVAATGSVPDIVKLDVETFEAAVLRGATDLIDRHRPILVVEVLKRRKRDHGLEITDLMQGRGYRHVALPDRPSWTVEDTISGSGTVDRDWLLYPDDLPAELPDAWVRWRERLDVCTADRNPRVPIASSIRAA
ncbi:MAG: FkbM family methyltransferase, partial [Actinomycetota bacterium]